MWDAATHELFVLAAGSLQKKRDSSSHPRHRSQNDSDAAIEMRGSKNGRVLDPPLQTVNVCCPAEV
jgi:hypothetical protein